ncbi:MAG TPA: sigma 54-interacting transcriptional regulator [Chondromyces sp.]|nr:sigma 54-interacting transcriptional regulator [Chondromyces sp.]
MNIFELNSLMTHIFDSIYEGFEIIDKNGDFIFINRAAEREFGIVREEWIGKNVEGLLPNSIIAKALHTGMPQIHNHIHILNKNFIVHAAPLRYEGEIVGAVATHYDDTELKKLKSSIESVYLNEYINFLENELHRVQMLPLEMSDFIISTGNPLAEKLLKLRKLGPTDIPILIRGESGVGKEIIARSIHQLSDRKGKPYITINCAAIPESLLESELFGYEEGAFTGAKKSGNKGKFELANGGTIFLDEIGDMSYHLQAKLLRVLQQKELVRIGGSKIIPLDVRVITATHQKLESMIKNHSFREDLYYRINGFTINIPPLRERKSDIEILILHFMKEFSYKYNKHLEISKEAKEFLLNQPLPGNVRELRSALEHGFVLAETNEIQISDLPGTNMGDDLEYSFKKSGIVNGDNASFTPNLTNSLDYTENMRRLEIELIIQALKRTNNNRSEAIKLLGISRQSFYDRLKKYENEIISMEKENLNLE